MMTPSSDINTLAVGNPSGLAVLVLHSWWGLGGQVLDATRRLTEAGMAVVAPDPYASKTASTVAEATALRESLDMDRAFQRLENAATLLDEQAPGWSAVGWSMGASFASCLAGRARRLALFYGGDEPEPPVSVDAVLQHLAEHDEDWFFARRVTSSARRGSRTSGWQFRNTPTQVRPTGSRSLTGPSSTVRPPSWRGGGPSNSG